jgi:hypothetical protein
MGLLGLANQDGDGRPHTGGVAMKAEFLELLFFLSQPLNELLRREENVHDISGAAGRRPLPWRKRRFRASSQRFRSEAR